MKNKTFLRAWLFTLFASAFVFSNVPSAQAETFTNAGGTLFWTNAANWVEGTVPNAIGATAIFNTALANQSASLSNSTPIGGITVGSITFNSTGTFSMGIPNGTAGGPLTFDEIGTGPATITTSGGGTGNSTISATCVFTDSLRINANNTAASTGIVLSGAITGDGGLTKEGDGNATISTVNKAYTGATILNGGRTRVSPSGSLTGTSSFTVNAGAQIEVIVAGTVTLGAGNLNLNGSGLVTGPNAAFPGAIRNVAGLLVTINNPVVLQSDTLIHVQATVGTGINPTPTGSTTFAGAISGPGRLTLTAPGSNIDQGSLILTSANSYQGGTVVNGGIISVTGASATLGTGNVTVDNAAAPSAIAKLVIQTGVANAIADTATLTLAGGGADEVADQSYVELGAGVNETVGALVLAGVTQAGGTYGSSASSATFTNNQFFAGSGIVTVVGAPALPSLTITLSAPNVIISWPTSATGYTLQQTATLSSPITWTDVTNPVVVSGTNNTVTLDASSGNGFFRLRQ